MEGKDLKILYTPECWRLAEIWTANAGLDKEGKGTETEIMWFGRAKRIEEGVLIDRLWLPDSQRADGGKSEIDGDAMNRMWQRVIADGAKEGLSKRDAVRLVNMGGHSHCRTNAFQSGTDQEYLWEKFASRGWFVGVTHNLKGETYGEITVVEPFHVVIKAQVGVKMPVYEWESAAAMEARTSVKRAFEVVPWKGRGILDGWKEGVPIGLGDDEDEVDLDYRSLLAQYEEELKEFGGDSLITEAGEYEIYNGRLWRWDKERDERGQRRASLVDHPDEFIDVMEQFDSQGWGRLKEEEKANAQS